MSKIWQKESKIKMDKTVEKFLTGDDFLIDMELAEYDIKGSLGHLHGLLDAKIINHQEFHKLQNALIKIGEDIKQGKLCINIEDEDIHTVVENALFKEIGELAGKLHTMRSRNDQIATDLKLYIKDMIGKIMVQVKDVIEEIKKAKKIYGKLVMPGYSHMQLAMPSSVGLWLGAFEESFKDDLSMLSSVSLMNDKSPLGSAVGYGAPLKYNKKLVAMKLGFSGIINNDLYCQNSRGKNELQVLNSLYQVMMTINKFASDALIFSMKEFEYLELPDNFLTGSSIMVHKKNYDVFELLKSKVSVVGGNINQVMLICNNLNSGYNRNFQDLKLPLINSFELVSECLEVMVIIVKNLKFNKDKLVKAMDVDLFTTKNVYEQVKRGVPFRTAYKKIKYRK